MLDSETFFLGPSCDGLLEYWDGVKQAVIIEYFLHTAGISGAIRDKSWQVDLYFFRDTDGREVDFVVAENRTPTLMVECK